MCIRDRSVDKVRHVLKESREGSVLLWSSIPCTGGSQWNVWNLARYPNLLPHMQRHWSLFTKLWASFVSLAEVALRGHQWIAIEWPRDCTYWSEPDVMDFLDRHSLTSVMFDGCALGMVSVVDGRPVRKPWRAVSYTHLTLPTNREV